MATRHLYETPDIHATLLTAISERNGKLIAQTVQELTLSGLDAFPTLLLGWFLSQPNPEISKRCYLAFLTTQLESLVAAVQQIKPYELPPLPPQAPPLPLEKPTRYTSTWPFPPSWEENQKARYELALKFAVKSKNAKHAAYLTSVLLGTEDSLRHILQQLGIQAKFITLLETTKCYNLRYRMLEHMYSAVLYEPMPQTVPTITSTPKGRCFSIPNTVYSTWGIQPKPLNRLVGLPLHILEPDATPFWKEQVRTYQITRKDDGFHFPDDTLLEKFYETNFPNDIPDEWSKQERAKSHPNPVQLQIQNPWMNTLSLILSM